MTGRRSHGRLSALNGVVHQGTSPDVNHQLTIREGDGLVDATPLARGGR